MDELLFEKTKIVAREIILGFVDINLALLSSFDSRKIYKNPLAKYEDFRIDEKKKFKNELSRLTQKKFIKKYFQDKTEYIELTKKGKLLLRKYITDQLIINNPEKWDKKWRMVIFDIPNKKRKLRDAVRQKLIRIGFIELQESVYIYPFECFAEINFLKNIYYLGPYIQYIVAERIETETNLIKRFLNLHILNKNML